MPSIVQFPDDPPRVTSADVDTLLTLHQRRNDQLLLLERKARRVVQSLRAGRQPDSALEVDLQTHRDPDGAERLRLVIGGIIVYEEIKGTEREIRRSLGADR